MSRFDFDQLKAAVLWGVTIAGGRPLPSLEQLDYYADVCGINHAVVLRAVVQEQQETNLGQSEVQL